MRWVWAAAAQTKSTAEASGRGVAVIRVRKGGGGSLQCRAAVWSGGMGAAPGGQTRVQAQYFEDLGQTGWEGEGPTGGEGVGGCNMLEKRGRVQMEDNERELQSPTHPPCWLPAMEVWPE